MVSRSLVQVPTVANIVAISEEWPNGSICQAVRGRASSPKFSSTNRSPNKVTEKKAIVASYI